MADIGRFYGEIGFNLNRKGLDEAQSAIDGTGKKTSWLDSIMSHFVFTFGDVVNIAQKAVAIFVDLITEYGKQELALTQLTNAMKLQGIYTEEAFKENVKYAESLALTTKYADEEIESLMTLLTSFGLHGEQLRKTTLAVLDYNALTGKGTTEIAMVLGKAFQGNTTMLARLGIKFDETKSSAGQYADILDKVASKSRGFAEAEGKSTLGVLSNLSKGFNELKEELGGFLIPLFDRFAIALQNDFKWITNALKGVKGFIDYFKGVKEKQINAENMTTAAILAAVDIKSEGEIQAEEEKNRKIELLRAKDSVKLLAKERRETHVTIDEQIKRLNGLKHRLNEQSDLYQIYNDAVIALEEEKSVKYAEIDNLIVANFTGGITSMLDGTRSFAEAAGDIWNNFKAMIISLISEMIAKWLLFTAMTAMFGPLGSGIGKILGFDEGGVVPGVKGTPRLIMAHAGETVLPTHKTSNSFGGDSFNFNITMHGSDKKYADSVANKIFDRVRRNKKV
jgi:hypothetical protein